MLIQVFKSNQKVVNGLSIVLIILLWIPAFFLDAESFEWTVFSGYRSLDVMLIVSLLSVQSIYLNYIASEFKLVKDNSHLTSLMFIVLNSCMFWMFDFNPIVLSNTFILIALHQLFRIYNSKSDHSISFSAGLLIGVAGLIYPPTLIFFVLLWMALVYTTTPTWRDFIVSLIGLFVPVLYFLVYHFVWGDITSIHMNNYFDRLYAIQVVEMKLFHKIFIGSLLAVFMMSVFNLFVTIGRSVVRTSKMLILLLIMLLLGIVTVVLNQYDFIASLMLISIPLAIILANFFQNFRKLWLAELIFTLIIFSIVAGHFS